MYYLRSRPAVDAIKFTVDAEAIKAGEAAEVAADAADAAAKLMKAAPKAAVASQKDEDEPTEEEVAKNLAAMMCSLENKDECLMCSG